MSAPAAAYPRARRTRLDLASRLLLRAVMDERWQPEEAATSLLRDVHDDRLLLRLLRARVVRVLLERPTDLARRAVATLDAALAASEAPRSVTDGPAPTMAPTAEG